MANESDDIMFSISADVAALRRSQKKMEEFVSGFYKTAENQFGKVSKSADKSFKDIEASSRRMRSQLDNTFSKPFSSIAKPLAGITAALGANELRKMTDTWTDLNSRVALAAGGLEQGTEVMGRLGEMARRTYSELEQTAESYLSNSTALQELGYSTDQALDYTESLNNALVVSGAKGQRAATVTDALAKAMALGKLQGVNLNTVISQGGRVAEALAAGLDTTVGGLRKLGAQGKITGNDIVKSLSSQMEVLRKEAAEMPATIGDGFTLLNNALLEYVGNADSATGISAKVSEALVIIADNFDKVADAGLQVAAVIAGALVGRSLGGMIKALGMTGSALIAFTRTLNTALASAQAVAGLSGAFAGLGAVAGPLGAIIGGAVVLGLTQYSMRGIEAAQRTEALNAEMTKLGLLAPKAADGIDEAAVSLSKLTDAETQRKLKEIREELDAIRKGAAGSDGELEKFRQTAWNSKSNSLFANDEQKRDNTAIDELIKLSKSAEQVGAPLGEILKKIEEIRQTDVSKGVVQLSNDLQGVVERTKALHALTNQVADTFDLQDARAAVQELSNHLDILGTKGEISPKLKDDAQKIISDLLKTEEGADDAAAAILRLGAANPNMSGFFGKLALAIQEMGKVVIAADEAADAMAGVSVMGSSKFSRGGRALAREALLEERKLNEEYVTGAKQREALGKAQYALENKIAQVRTQAEKDGRKLTEAQIREIAQAQLAGEASRSAEGKKPKRERESEYERLTQSISDRTAAMVAETEVQRQLNPLIDDYGYAVEKARTEQELLNAAQKANIAVTPELRAEISATAEQYAQATVEAGRLAETQDKIRQKAEEMAEFQKDLTRGIVDGLIQGKNAADLFADALSKIGNKLLDLAFNGLFDNGGIGGLFGGGGQGAVARGGGIGLYADGGEVSGLGTGTSDSILARLSNGEFVVNAKDAARHRTLLEAINSGAIPGFKSGGMIGSPSVGAPNIPLPQVPSAAQVGSVGQSGGGDMNLNISVDVSGARGNKEIEEFVQKGVRQGISNFQQSSHFVTLVGRAVGQARSANIL